MTMGVARARARPARRTEREQWIIKETKPPARGWNRDLRAPGSPLAHPAARRPGTAAGIIASLWASFEAAHRVSGKACVRSMARTGYSVTRARHVFPGPNAL